MAPRGGEAESSNIKNRGRGTASEAGCHGRARWSTRPALIWDTLRFLDPNSGLQDDEDYFIQSTTIFRGSRHRPKNSAVREGISNNDRRKRSSWRWLNGLHQDRAVYHRPDADDENCDGKFGVQHAQGRSASDEPTSKGKKILIY